MTSAARERFGQLAEPRAGRRVVAVASLRADADEAGVGRPGSPAGTVAVFGATRR